MRYTRTEPGGNVEAAAWMASQASPHCGHHGESRKTRRRGSGNRGRDAVSSPASPTNTGFSAGKGTEPTDRAFAPHPAEKKKTAARTRAFAARRLPVRGNLLPVKSQVFLDQLNDVVLVVDSHHLPLDLPVPEQDECGDSADAELRGDVRAVVHVQFGHPHLPLEFLRHLFENRCDDPARPAPGSPEVDQHRGGPGFDRRLEVPAVQFQYGSGHRFLPARPVVPTPRRTVAGRREISHRRTGSLGRFIFRVSRAPSSRTGPSPRESPLRRAWFGLPRSLHPPASRSILRRSGPPPRRSRVPSPISGTRRRDRRRPESPPGTRRIFRPGPRGSWGSPE